ncbi:MULTISPECIES: TetR/AcrR family transcriptional regulator [unclassified Microbacterium]|uniref:TetR/AcrR family transcriptional regulator n=1 Tax=unclassified Microbacterium TaxID=2609290 RepID=UPI00097EAE83|nr:TetR/AcrR family transcriptional regulator [Microbacterium sp. JB110]RCS60195.1 TetR/AcrR family transcriptional regulator [Microbacterium sp. JB110]SJM48249.1 Transcriptional regulator, TetR family [Frigoribacterium sp. JB110]
MSARERILDAAAVLMRTSGLAETTTRAIAREAGCSEALLYKNFSDKQHIFTAVLKERMPRLSTPDALIGEATVAANLTSMVAELVAFYRESFPIAASMLGSASLRAAHRESVGRLGSGPDVPAQIVQRYIDGELAAGRIREDVDSVTTARLLTGAALFEALQAAYGDDPLDDPHDLARSIVTAAFRGLQ